MTLNIVEQNNEAMKKIQLKVHNNKTRERVYVRVYLSKYSVF